MKKFNYKSENVKRLLDLRIKHLQSGIKHEDENWAAEVADLVKIGEIGKEDILELQNRGIKPVQLLGVFARMKTNNSGLSYHDAVQLGHKVQFIYLSKHINEDKSNGMAILRDSMKTHEEVINAIFNETYPAEKLEILKALPSCGEWDSIKGAEAYNKIFTD